MKVYWNILPAWNTEAANAGGGPPAATQEPNATPAPSPAPTSDMTETPVQLDETEKWVLESFDPITQDFDEVETAPTESLPVVQVPESQPPVQTPQTASSPPVQTPGTQPPAVTTPTAPVVAAPQAAPTVSAGQPSTTPPAEQPQVRSPEPTASFDDLAEQITKQQDAFVKALAGQQYKLTEEDRELFLEKPEEVIAKVAAQVQVATTASVMKVFAQQLPVVVNGLIHARDRNQKYEDDFWGANPGLDRTAHRQLVGQIMQNVRTHAPNMDAPTFIKTVGQIVGGLAGVQPTAARAPSNGQHPAVNPQPRVSTPGPVVRQTGGAFVPGGAMGAPPSAHPAPQLSEWERLTALYQADESGAFET